MKRVVAGALYLFWPNLLDQIHVCAPGLKPGQWVRVVRLRGAPAPGVMGQCHVEGSNGFAGMVSVNSLYSRAEIKRLIKEADPAVIEKLKLLKHGVAA